MLWHGWHIPKTTTVNLNEVVERTAFRKGTDFDLRWSWTCRPSKLQQEMPKRCRSMPLDSERLGIGHIMTLIWSDYLYKLPERARANQDSTTGCLCAKSALIDCYNSYSESKDIKYDHCTCVLRSFIHFRRKPAIIFFRNCLIDVLNSFYGRTC